MENSRTDIIERTQQAYLDAVKFAAQRVASELRAYVEQSISPDDGRPLFSTAFAVESESTRQHRGPNRRLLSQGRRSVKVYGDGAADLRADLRSYIWSQVCYQPDSGNKVPICDVMFSMMPHIDMSTGNRHAAPNLICISPSGSDGFDAPELIKPIGQLRYDMDPSVVATLKEEVALKIKCYCDKNLIDARTGAKLHAAIASCEEIGSNQ